MIGHEEARREYVDDNIGWRYADMNNQMLCEVLQFIGGCNLVRLDEFIESLEEEGRAAGDELRERRREALRLFCDRRFTPAAPFEKLTDFGFAGHIEWIIQRKAAIERDRVVLPRARLGLKIENGGKKGGQASARVRSGEGSKKAAILRENAIYTGPESARVATLVRQTDASEQYVRQVLREEKANL